MTPPPAPGASPRIVDPGGQAERTRLSWNRTGLAVAVNAALLIHTDTGPLWRHLPALAMLAAAWGCFLFANRRYRQINTAVRSGRTVATVTHPRVLAVTLAAPMAIALTAILL